MVSHILNEHERHDDTLRDFIAFFFFEFDYDRLFRNVFFTVFQRNTHGFSPQTVQVFTCLSHLTSLQHSCVSSHLILSFAHEYVVRSSITVFWDFYRAVWQVGTDVPAKR